ncbi:MAG: helix-turn-helix transcriptional regulator [Sinimarinibacterium sp.]|jgi:DNA-binding transcriptional regulator YiaG
MADIASLLKAEIVRLSKKTARQLVAPLQRSTASHRHDIAALKKQIASLERAVATLQRANTKERKVIAQEPLSTKHRFVAKGLRPLRSRLGLSQEEFGTLVGVSAQSVYNWEHQTAKPRPAQLGAIATVRSMGKREAQKKLEEMSAR